MVKVEVENMFGLDSDGVFGRNCLIKIFCVKQKDSCR